MGKTAKIETGFGMEEKIVVYKNKQPTRDLNRLKITTCNELRQLRHYIQDNDKYQVKI